MRQAAFESINPATEEVIGYIDAFDAQAVDQALDVAAARASQWALTSADSRAQVLRQVAECLDSQRDRLAALMTAEMGKLITEAQAEVDKCAWVCRYYADHAPGFLADEEIASDAARSLVAHQPLGVVLAIMPWNFPLWQVFRFAAPAIAAGNVALLKHASNVMACALAIEEVWREAGAPPGVFTTLPIASADVGEVIADRRVQAVTLTGSDSAGRAVAAQAGKALKKCVLELGGSDPFVVLEDADLDSAVQKAVSSRFMNAGQSCIAAKRFIVVGSLADAFTEALVDATSALRAGDPMDRSTQLAPMARADLRDELHRQVEDAVSLGARLLTGGQYLSRPGYFYAPTVLSEVTAAMRAFREELFGPVAAVYRAGDEADALRLANATDFGLGGSVWTGDRERGLAFARRLDCGCAFVNELVKSDPRLPFGGIKDSGYGRELSLLGIREFVNSKTIWVD